MQDEDSSGDEPPLTIEEVCTFFDQVHGTTNGLTILSQQTDDKNDEDVKAETVSQHTEIADFFDNSDAELSEFECVVCENTFKNLFGDASSLVAGHRTCESCVITSRTQRNEESEHDESTSVES